MALDTKTSRREAIKAGIGWGLGLIAGNGIVLPNKAHSQGTYSNQGVISQDLIKAISIETWNSMSVDEQKRAIASWNNKSPQERGNINNMYTDLEAYLRTLSEQKRVEHNELTNAYYRASSESETPALLIFIPQRGRITREYAMHSPWIDLNCLQNGDASVIFDRECMREDTRGRRLNWNYIRTHGADRKFGETGPLKLKHLGERYYREGQTNSYHSKNGKPLQID
jgi:hypothetical protein